MNKFKVGDRVRVSNYEKANSKPDNLEGRVGAVIEGEQAIFIPVELEDMSGWETYTDPFLFRDEELELIP